MSSFFHFSRRTHGKVAETESGMHPPLFSVSALFDFFFFFCTAEVLEMESGTIAQLISVILGWFCLDNATGCSNFLSLAASLRNFKCLV